MAVKRVTRAKRASVGKTSAAAGCWGGCWYGACWGGCWPGLAQGDPRVVDALLKAMVTSAGAPVELAARLFEAAAEASRDQEKR